MKFVKWQWVWLGVSTIEVPFARDYEMPPYETAVIMSDGWDVVEKYDTKLQAMIGQFKYTVIRLLSLI